MILSRVNHVLRVLIFATVIFVSFPFDAHAYVDPGTGGLIIQGIIGAISVIGIGLKIYWAKVKTLYKNIMNIPSE
jgi:hypothetical protein